MNLKFDHALVALDQSEASDIMIDCLAHFEKFGTRKFTLYTSINIPYPGGAGAIDDESYKVKLKEYKERLSQFDFEVDIEVEFGINAYIPVKILEAVKRQEADYIIIANRGHNKFREFLLGSTATELLQRCTYPVYLINLSVSDESDIKDRKLYCVKSCRDSLQRILLPTDFSPTANRAFEVAKKLATDQTEKLNILHVQASGRKGVDDPDKLKGFDKEDTETLKYLRDEFSKVSDAEVDIRIRYGSPVQQILELAESDESSMIIMGSQGRGYVSDLFLGGVSLQVIRKAHIPILIIPADRSK